MTTVRWILENKCRYCKNPCGFGFGILDMDCEVGWPDCSMCEGERKEAEKPMRFIVGPPPVEDDVEKEFAKVYKYDPHDREIARRYFKAGWKRGRETK